MTFHLIKLRYSTFCKLAAAYFCPTLVSMDYLPAAPKSTCSKMLFWGNSTKNVHNIKYSY